MKFCFGTRETLSRMYTLEDRQKESEESKEKQNSSRPTFGRTLMLSLFGMWAATLNCLSNAAVSLEGDLDTRRCCSSFRFLSLTLYMQDADFSTLTEYYGGTRRHLALQRDPGYLATTSRT